MKILNTFTKVVPRGLRSQLILGISFFIVVSTSLFVFDLVNRQKVFYLKLNHDRGVSLSDNLAKIAASHVVANELDGLQNIVTAYKKIPGLEYAMVTTSEGIVLSHTNEKYLGLKPTDSVSTKLKPINAIQVLLEDQYIFDVASPIVNRDEIVGWARVGLSQRYLTANLAEIKTRGILYIVISLIAGSLFAMIVAGRLSKGLQKLVTVAQKIKDGDRNLRASPSKSIEVTQLGIAFNQMINEISANEKLLKMVLENMPVGVFILDAQGKILSINPAALQIWEGEKYVGMGDYDAYKGWFLDGKKIESHEWGVAVALNENRSVLDQEVEIEGFDGGHKTILNSCLPLHDDNENIVGAISINIDITERKHMELEREKNITELIQRNRDLEQFSYMVSHNIRGPVATMMGLSHILQEDLLNSAEKQQIVHGIGSSVQKLDEVIQDLNTILKVKRDVTEKKELVHFSALINDIKKSLSTLMVNQEIQFVCDFKSTDEIVTIKSYLYSILYNLISNSIKYRQPTIPTVINITSEVSENKTILHFKDNGIGIDLQKNGKDVFTLYKRFHFHIEGKGMGLFMVKTQVEALGGKISIQSKENIGTEFVIEFEN